MSNINAKATYLSKDQNWQDECTIYWFEVDSNDDALESGVYGVREAAYPEEPTPLNDEGYPIDYNEHQANLVLEVCQVTDELRAE